MEKTESGHPSTRARVRLAASAGIYSDKVTTGGGEEVLSDRGCQLISQPLAVKVHHLRKVEEIHGNQSSYVACKSQKESVRAMHPS